MKRTLFPTIVMAALLSASLFTEPASAQVLMSAGTTYSQDFNTLASQSSQGTNWTDNITIPGWYASQSLGNLVITNYRVSAGGANNGSLYSFGTGSDADRALGSIGSGTPGNFAYGVRIQNDTASFMTNFTVAYTGEEWRNGGNATAQKLSFFYTISSSPITTSDAVSNSFAWTPVTALDFTTPTTGATAAALDGNAAANRTVISAVTLPGVVVAPSQEIFLRWFDPNDSGNDHGVSIDDLTVTFSPVSITTNAPTYATVTPLAQTNKAGTTASFTVANDGSPAVSITYQWRHGGTPLSDTGNVYGSTTSTLTLSNVLAANGGSYDVVVANSAGSVTSAVSTLTVTDPAILYQSGSQARLAGENLTLSVGAAGTPTLAYQWFLGTTLLTGETGSAINFSSLGSANQGTYTCWVTNGLNTAVASTPIVLTVIVPPSATLALWNFNDTNAPLASPPPVSGSGTASLLNGVKPTFTTGVDADSGGTNRAWTTDTYPPQGTSNRTAGVQFSVSTLGYQNILLTWYERHSPGGSKYTRLQYTTDGTTFNDLGLNTMSTDGVFVLHTSDLSAIPAVNNNASFAFRVVSEFESLANPNYVGTSAAYASGGTIRYDLVSIFGDPSSAVSPATITAISGTTLSYNGGIGSQFVLLESANLAAAMSTWTPVKTNGTGSGTFDIPQVGTSAPKYYRIRSE
jgi:hypothetical protein